MDMHELHRTEELLHKGLKEINDKGELNNASLDVLGKTIDAMKDICKIKESENPSYGNRHGGMWTAEGSYGRMYYDGHRDGDGDGRYYEGRNYEGRNPIVYGNVRDNSYGNQDIIENLRRDMQNASSEQEREYIRNMIRKYEK
jgi:hypothetical protein